jgi:retron-type reverse transcriptase
MSTFSKYVRLTPASSPTDHYRRRQLRRAFGEHVSKGSLPALEQIAHPENLIQVFKELKANAGQAPGIDGVTYRDLSASEVGICMRALSQIVLNGLYHPAPSLLVQIPKTSGKGHRTLSIRAIMDRVVSAALNKALTPFWDKNFFLAPLDFVRAGGRGTC